MRWAVVEKLRNELESLGKIPIKVAIIGGSSTDPEVKLVTELYPQASITYLGIENYGNEELWIYLDLNSRCLIENQYDLVICSQVLEHIWNIGNAISVISTLTTPLGFIWVNCPASNIPHGSPEYFSSGYSPDYLKKNFEYFHFKTLKWGCIGSKRYYRTTHLLHHWLTQNEHNHPIFGYRISNGITLGKIRELLYRIPGRLLMLTWSNLISENIIEATESYYFGQKELKNI